MGSKVQKAQTEVRKLAEAERSLSAKLTAKTAELADTQEQLGQSTLAASLTDGETDSAAIRRVGEVRTEIDAIEKAILSARSERLKAIPLVWQAEAAELRSQTRELAAEAGGRQEKTDKMLADLEAWEGVPYVPARNDRSPLSGPEVTGPAPTVMVVPIPKTEYMRQKAQGLQARAEQLEARRPVQSGRAEGPSVEALLDAIFADPMVMGPTVASVETWTAQERAKQEAASARLEHSGQVGWFERDNAIRYRIVWKDSELSPGECRSERVKEAVAV